MKRKFSKKLEIKKITISYVKGGVTDTYPTDCYGCTEPPKKTENCEPDTGDHTRSCPSWNVAC